MNFYFHRLAAAAYHSDWLNVSYVAYRWHWLAVSLNLDFTALVVILPVIDIRHHGLMRKLTVTLIAMLSSYIAN